MEHIVIAIDGPSASGKSTVAREVARALGYYYVDSGALYRGVTWKALQSGTDTGNAEAVERVAAGLDIRFRVIEGAVRFAIAGRDPGAELRTATIDSNVSPVAAIPAVRSSVNRWLREMRQLGSLVVEGRDIGTAVFPDAEHKFYLDASPEERARRRHEEAGRGDGMQERVAVQKALQKRDAIDSSRKADPLRVAAGAVVLDTTTMGIRDVVAAILNHIRQQIPAG